jgi:hypothetical protein
MDRLIRTIVFEHKNKRIHLTDIESALKERGINLFADQSDTINSSKRSTPSSHAASWNP